LTRKVTLLCDVYGVGIPVVFLICAGSPVSGRTLAIIKWFRVSSA